MSQYLAWYREKFPSQRVLLDDAADRLKFAVYDLHGIMNLHAEDWCRLEIPEGFGKQLVRNARRFLGGKEARTSL
jgi:hypothetical protein